jgi:DNA-binding transcriptional LysR family regulator
LKIHRSEPLDNSPSIVAGFQSRHPGVDMEIVVESQLIDIVAAGCDAGGRCGPLTQKDMISIPIGPRTQQLAFAASPAYVQQRHAQCAGGPDRLCSDPVSAERGHAAAVEVAVSQQGHDRGSCSAPHHQRRCVECRSELCQSGDWVIAAFSKWLDKDFKDGTLVPLLEDFWTSHDGPRLYYPSRHTPPPLPAFIDYCSGKTSSPISTGSKPRKL